MKAALLLAAFLFLIFGCAQQEEGAAATGAVSNLCISACQEAMLRNADLSDGPCLLNPIPDYPGWVCDVAHSPRQSVDNLEKNQCGSFRDGKASKFVEVSADCEVIRLEQQFGK